MSKTVQNKNPFRGAFLYSLKGDFPSTIRILTLRLSTLSRKRPFLFSRPLSTGDCDSGIFNYNLHRERAESYALRPLNIKGLCLSTYLLR